MPKDATPVQPACAYTIPDSAQVAGSVTTAGIQQSLGAAIEARRGMQMLLPGSRI
ncbi:hypothetical protein [Mycobacterium sp. RTGN5]|uniref:hypothetical protein n=1 Tax=Mycobacterium sp. RTGN5 TaxID=3016522 RepID=UPI0029C79E81|nr:hypothetical protein [Mycobacterium sp. RTGN5]